MLHTIKGSVSFSQTGEEIAINFSPTSGITAVVGPNGSGKTFTASESLRYLLFGTKALRSTLSSIKSLTLTGTVTINNRQYRIHRSLEKASIEDEETMLAVGATEVTNKVVEILGYGQEVFDLCNAAVQRQTTVLGDMRPAARKKLIDRVSGLEQATAVETFCRDESNGFKRAAEALATVLPAVGEEPRRPLAYTASDRLQARLDEARRGRSLLRELQAEIEPVAEPVEPEEDPLSPQALRDLELYQEGRDASVAAHKELERQANLTTPTDWTRENALIAKTRGEWEKLLPKPKATRPEIIAAENACAARRAAAETECPSCGHTFNTGNTPQPLMNEAECAAERAAWRRWEGVDGDEPLNEFGALSLADYTNVIHMIEVNEAAATARQALDTSDLPTDRSDELTKARAVQSDWDSYNRARLRADGKRKEQAALQEKIDGLKVTSDQDYENLVQQLAAAKAYEQALASYTDAVDKRKDVSDKIAEAQEKAAGFKQGAEALGKAKAQVKALLAPMISSEASTLISDMTHGKLKHVYVDEDMNITVDGKALETLSGGGSTVANIALRIALGRILVGDVFPVFIGDEMDGDLDHERREATIQAMVALKEHLTQIILITHKDVSVADTVVEIGE